MSLRLNRFFSHYKKKIKTSLWKKISRKSGKKLNALIFHTVDQKNGIHPPRVESTNKQHLIDSHLSQRSAYHIEEFAKQMYIHLVYFNLLYLHYETQKVDFCIYAIQKNPILAHVFQLSYNEFRSKFYRLLVISSDQGENFSLALNKPAELFSLFTYLIRFLFPPLAILGGIIRMGINELNKKTKSRDSKNTLNYCKTDENFTKMVSLLFSLILVKNLPDEGALDLFVKKNFSIFWKILQEHAEASSTKDFFSADRIEKIWAYCFCLFELTTVGHSVNLPHPLKIENTLKPHQQKNEITFFPLYPSLSNTKPNTAPVFDIKKFDMKKITELPTITSSNINHFWKNKIRPPLLENSKPFSELLID
ncbi:hypothetical protein [Rickettsiella grylli]|uniref:Uncharacterized protein n=1 Tax=Rickettsiella grylli TaxID=59196 RepID=A8PLE4_9COXI|nr:hypothetical protein [Rickettsiella grylli]EDP46747.1 hypothetical protein RICGR_0401 [Rickettsiella grylli]